MISIDRAEFPAPFDADISLAGRSMLVHRAQVIPVECVARGYLSGSGWAQYRAGGSVCGVALPPGLRESDRLPEPIFTPTTKADQGHDLPLTFDETVELVGRGLAERLRELTVGHLRADRRGRSGARHPGRRHEGRIRVRRGRSDADR